MLTEAPGGRYTIQDVSWAAKVWGYKTAKNTVEFVVFSAFFAWNSQFFGENINICGKF